MCLENKKKIVYKQNPVIRGHFVDSNNSLTLLSELDFDVLNAIYLLAQQSLFNIHPEFHMQYIKIEVALIDIRKVLDRPSSKNYKEIRGSIESLYKTEIVLKDFTHPLDGIKYKEYNTRILHEYGFLKDNKNIYVLKFDEMFLVNILRHTDRQTNKKIGNFTPIDVVSVRELRSKYAKRLYEYLVSIKNHKKEFSLNIDSLNKLFGVNHKIIARHTEIVKRIHLQVSSKVPFSYEVHRYDKLISFRIIARGMELIGA